MASLKESIDELKDVMDGWAPSANIDAELRLDPDDTLIFRIVRACENMADALDKIAGKL